MKKLLSILFVAVILLTACSSGGEETGSEETTSSGEAVVAGGSTSVEPLLVEMINDYNAENPDKTAITYDATGSSAGVEGALNGNYDVGAASREIKDEEFAENDQLTAEVLAYDGIAVVVNSANGVTDLTMEQVRQIYVGEITNWSEVGGADGDIAVISRDSASGTRGAFEEIVGFEGELVSSAQESASNGEVMTNVAGNEYAIGYASFDYLDDTVNPVNIDGAEPTVENVQSNTYGISRPFNMVYLADNDNSDAMTFIEWVKENKDSYVEELGLIGV